MTHKDLLLLITPQHKKWREWGQQGGDDVPPPQPVEPSPPKKADFSIFCIDNLIVGVALCLTFGKNDWILLNIILYLKIYILDDNDLH